MSKQVLTERAHFWESFSSLVSRGYPLCQVLDMASQDADRELRDVVPDVKRSFENGCAFSDSMTRHNEVFSDFETIMVRSAEAAGNLDIISRRIAEALAESPLKGEPDS